MVPKKATRGTSEAGGGTELATEEGHPHGRYYFDISTHGHRHARAEHGDDVLLIRSLCTRLRSASDDIARLTQQTRPAADFVDLLDANDAIWRALLALERIKAGGSSRRPDCPRTMST
jgi:hypothetical protein